MQFYQGHEAKRQSIDSFS